MGSHIWLVIYGQSYMGDHVWNNIYGCSSDTNLFAHVVNTPGKRVTVRPHVVANANDMDACRLQSPFRIEPHGHRRLV